MKNKNIFIVIGIIVVCFVFYGNTLKNGYALDDTLVLTQNKFTKQGLKGLSDIFKYDSFTGFFGKDKNLVAGGRYRPLSLASLAIEYQFFGLNPLVSHLVNILMYILTCILLYLILAKLIPDESKQWYLSIPFVATFLFVIHPIHTEVVANIKGRDEMMTLLGSLASLWYILLYFETKEKSKQLRLLIYSGISFFLALLSKENAITFLAIIPAALYIFIKPHKSKIIITFIPIFVSSVIFLIIRHHILKVEFAPPIAELMNNPFLYATTSEKFATIFYTLAIYLKLLVFPHPLTFDYYPFHIAITNWLNPVVIFSVLFYVGISIYMFLGIRKKTIMGFGILIFLASLSIVSNLIFPIGTFMNERFIFISSIGFTIVVAFIMNRYIPKFIKQTNTALVVSIILLSGVFTASAYKTIRRNKVWKDDYTLFTTDVNVSFNGAKSTCSAGGKLYESAKLITDSIKRIQTLDKSLFYLRRSVAIHPRYTDAMLLLGNVFFEYKRYDSTIYYYKRIVSVAPFFANVYENVPIVANMLPNVDDKIALFEYFNKINNNDFDINYQLGTLWGKEKGDITKAIGYLERAYQINPNRKEALKDLGVAYGIAGKTNEAIQIFLKAIENDPDDSQTYFNLGVSYQRIGKTKESQYYILKAQELAKQKK